MSIRAAARMSAIMGSLKAGREERRDIAEKRIKNQRDTENYEYKKKLNKIDLENKRRTGQISDMEFKMKQEQMKPFFKAVEARDKLKNNWIDEAEKRNSFGMNALGQAAKQTALDIARVSQDTIRNVADRKVQSELGKLNSKDKAKKTKPKDTDGYAVFEAANKMAKDDLYGSGTHSEKVKKYMPEARKMLGLGKAEKKGKRDLFNKYPVEKIRMKAPNGRIWNIDADKASDAEKRGLTRL